MFRIIGFFGGGGGGIIENLIKMTERREKYTKLRKVLRINSRIATNAPAGGPAKNRE